jgi:mannosyltransferase OCH1-like enzyme
MIGLGRGFGEAFLLLILTWSGSAEFERWKLPVLPLTEPPNHYASSDRRIPRHVWISVKSVPETLPHHLESLKKREEASGWKVHIEDNAAQLAFMTLYFSNTSTLWAFQQISPRVGNAASDIWRYSLLYLFGGVYLDDDSYLGSSFEKMVAPDDGIILTKEPNEYQDECYKNDFHLSDTSLIKTFNSSSYVKGINDGRTLASWAIFSEPRHPIIKRTLENIVELLKLEYLRQSALKLQYFDMKWKRVMCTTGPTVLAVSAKQVFLETGKKNQTMPGRCRIEQRDFAQYGGKFKFRKNVTDRSHYMFSMQYDLVLLLRSYKQPTDLSSFEGKLLCLERNLTTREIRYFLLKNGTIRNFADVQHASSYGFTERAAVVMDDKFYESLPKGPELSRDSNAAIKDTLASLHDKLITVINKRNRRKYYMIENGTWHGFANYDHFTSFNFSLEQAFPISDEMFAKIPMGNYYKMATGRALENKLVVVRKKKAFYLVRNNTYFSFRDWDHLVQSAPTHFRDAVEITDSMLADLSYGGQLAAKK